MKPRVLAKFFQRRFYTFLSTWSGFSVFIVCCFTTFLLLGNSYFYSCGLIGLRGAHIHCTIHDFHDNIGHLNLETFLGYGPIDAVYTWVNGSDPRWAEKKMKWEVIEKLKMASELSSENITFKNSSEDDSMSKNRYRESNELRYSLRSLERYAPWIRKIYIVTDSQIPNWLNLDNDRVQVISHEDIFPNKSHLPVFSSPAIEAHLHLIPNLSKKFIYFNDDVFLGSQTLPDDFFSLAGTQKFHLSWDVPNCAPGCSDHWIGDGYCDKACNVSACDFDFPDCANGSTAVKTRYGNSANSGYSKSSHFCAPACPLTWLGDKVCDMKCKSVECGWDMGDCGISLVTEDFPGTTIIPSRNVSVSPLHFTPEHHTRGGAHGASRTRYLKHQRSALDNATILGDTRLQVNQTHKDEEATPYNFTLLNPHVDYPMVLTVPFGSTHSVYFNMSYLQCLALSKEYYSSKESRISSGIDNGSDGSEASEGEEYNFDRCERSRIVGTPLSGGPFIPFGVGKSTADTLNFTYSEIEYTFIFDPDTHSEVVKMLSTALIHSALMLQKHHMLLLLVSKSPTAIADTYANMFTDELSTSPITPDNRLMLLDAFEDKVEVRFGVHGYNSHNMVNASTYFAIIIDFKKPSNPEIESTPPIPVGMGVVSGSICSTDIIHGEGFSNPSSNGNLAVGDIQLEQHPVNYATSTSIVNHKDLSVCSNMSLFTNSTSESNITAPLPKDISQGIRLRVSLHPPYYSQANVTSERIMLSSVLTFPSGLQYTYSETLCHASNHGMVVSHPDRKSVSSSLSAETTETLSSSCKYATLGDLLYPSGRYAFTSKPESIYLVVPMPVRWQCLDAPVHIHIQYKVNIVHEDMSSNRLVDLTGYTIWGGRVPAEDNVVDFGLNGTFQASNESSAFSSNHSNYTVSNVTNPASSPPVVAPEEPKKDTYGASLVYVNRLYHKEFGSAKRKVPAHMPHTIDRDVVTEMQQKWPERWESTSSHRFRSPTDMQYSFSYYYYLMNRYKASPPDLLSYIHKEIDSDKDGWLRPNEFLTLASIVYHKSPSLADIETLRNCTFLAVSRNMSASDESTLMPNRSDVGDSNAAEIREPQTIHKIRSSSKYGEIEQSLTMLWNPTVEEALLCNITHEGLLKYVDWYPRTHVIGEESDVAFEMIGDNITETLSQLNSIRARRSKFICVNDQMKNPSTEVQQVLKDFMDALFPFPSQFELPDGVTNPTLFLDVYMNEHNSKYQSRGRMFRNWYYNIWSFLKQGIFGTLIKPLVYFLHAWVEGGEYHPSVQFSHLGKLHTKSSSDLVSKNEPTFGVRVFLPYSSLAFGAVGLIGLMLLRRKLIQHRNEVKNKSDVIAFSKDDSDDEDIESPRKVRRDVLNSRRIFGKVIDQKLVGDWGMIQHSEELAGDSFSDEGDSKEDERPSYTANIDRANYLGPKISHSEGIHLSNKTFSTDSGEILSVGGGQGSTESDGDTAGLIHDGEREEKNQIDRRRGSISLSVPAEDLAADRGSEAATRTRRTRSSKKKHVRFDESTTAKESKGLGIFERSSSWANQQVENLKKVIS